jgi:hypothetical protein
MVVTGAAQKPRPMKVQPHFLGGSNNLVTERKRREKAELQVKQTKENLYQLTASIVPKVQELSKAVQVSMRNFELSLHNGCIL